MYVSEQYLDSGIYSPMVSGPWARGQADEERGGLFCVFFFKRSGYLGYLVWMVVRRIG